MVRIEKMGMGSYDENKLKVKYKGFEQVSNPFLLFF